MNKDPAEIYVTNFRRYAANTGHNDVALIRTFILGLNDRLRSELNRHLPRPTTLMEWQNAAITSDRQWVSDREQAKEARERDNPQRGSNNPSPRRENPRPSYQVNLPQAPPPRPPANPQRQRGPNDMDVDEARAKGLCFNCGKHGHMSRFCPDKKRGPTQVRSLNIAELSEEDKAYLLQQLAGPNQGF